MVIEWYKQQGLASEVNDSYIMRYGIVIEWYKQRSETSGGAAFYIMSDSMVIGWYNHDISSLWR